MGTHLLRSVFAVELFLARLYPETIIIIERWPINDFLRYIRIQVSDLNKDISEIMASKKVFYTIAGAEVI